MGPCISLYKHLFAEIGCLVTINDKLKALRALNTERRTL
jgi:hypothetical protein